LAGGDRAGNPVSGRRHGRGGGGNREEAPTPVAPAARLALPPARLRIAGACGVVGAQPASGRLAVGATLVVVVLACVGHRPTSSCQKPGQTRAKASVRAS